jgi:UDP-glucose 4-epimerase
VITIFCASALASAQPTIYGDGTQTRDYVYVGDVVAAFLAAADRGRPGTWNIGTGMEVSVLELMEIIAGVAGRALSPVFAPARPGELARSVLAVDRAAGELGWRAVAPLAEGIRRVYQWIQAGAPDRASC